jgi:ornithine cyclodeaminase
MIILTADDVQKALPMAQCIEAMKRAYAALSDGRAEAPLRARLSIPPYEATGLFMPAFVQDEQGDSLAVKIVTLYPHNSELHLPFIHALVIAFDPESGRPEAIIEGSSLTAIRTGAASGAATDILARKDSHVVALIGAGVQGRRQIEAVCTVRQIKTAWIYDIIPERVKNFINELAGKGPIPVDLRAATSSKEAITQADIICTATTSKTPVFNDQNLIPGTHINGVGSYSPDMQEIPSETVCRAMVIVDSRSASLAESGDLIHPIQRGLITETHIHADLGEIILARKPGRTNKDQITFFKSVGLAVQDAVAVTLAIQNARRMKLGQEFHWS